MFPNTAVPGSGAAFAALQGWSRAAAEHAERAAAAIIADLRARDDAALRDLTRHFDRIDFAACGTAFFPAEIAAAIARAAPEDRAAPELAGERIRAFHARKCHDAIAESGAAAIIPLQERQTLVGWQRRGERAQRSPARIKALRPDDLATMERLPSPKTCRYQDALFELKVRAARLPGQRLVAGDFDRQAAEFQVRLAVLNGFTALGIPVTETVG